MIVLLGPTDLAYIITFFTLAKIGFTLLCLSPRLAPSACETMIRENSAIAIILRRPTLRASIVPQIHDSVQVETLYLVAREESDKSPSIEPQFPRENIDREAEKQWTLKILYSSGSTGLPKPIFLPHRHLMMKIPSQKGRTEFNTFPFFQGYGNWVVVHGMMDRKTVIMYNPDLPVTAD